MKVFARTFCAFVLLGLVCASSTVLAMQNSNQQQLRTKARRPRTPDQKAKRKLKRELKKQQSPVGVQQTVVQAVDAERIQVNLVPNQDDSGLHVGLVPVQPVQEQQVVYQMEDGIVPAEGGNQADLLSPLYATYRDPISISKKHVAVCSGALATIGLVFADAKLNGFKVCKTISRNTVGYVVKVGKFLGQKLGLVAKPKTWWNRLFGK